MRGGIHRPWTEQDDRWLMNQADERLNAAGDTDYAAIALTMSRSEAALRQRMTFLRQKADAEPLAEWPKHARFAEMKMKGRG